MFDLMRTWTPALPRGRLLAMASRTSSPLVHPDASAMDLFDVLSALSDPIRQQIVVTVARYPGIACGRIELGIAKSSMSHHYRVLREAGILHQTDQGTSRASKIRHADLESRFPGLIDMVLRESRVGVAPIRDDTVSS